KGQNRSTCARPTPSRRSVSRCRESGHDRPRMIPSEETEKTETMRIPFLQSKTRDYALEALSAKDSPAISAIHREDFLRPWTDGEFASLLGQNTVFGFVARETGKGAAPPVGFVLARLAAGEGEILTV